jgi:ribosomal protein S18 acetylase RimI-like enzyme
MTITIKEASRQDYDGVLEVYTEVEEYHRLNSPWFFKKPEPELFPKAYYDELLNNNNALFLLAMYEDKIAGFIIGLKQDTPGMPMLVSATYVLVDNLGIKRCYREKGIGTLLMNALEKWAKEKGVNEVRLNVWSFNKDAIAFYESKGYLAFSQKMRKMLE